MKVIILAGGKRHRMVDYISFIDIEGKQMILHIIENLKTLLKTLGKKKGKFNRLDLDEVEMKELVPWYRGFTGEIVKHNNNSWIFT